MGLRLGNVITKRQMQKVVKRTAEVHKAGCSKDAEARATLEQLEDLRDVVIPARDEEIRQRDEENRNLQAGVELKIAGALSTAREGWEKEAARQLDEQREKLETKFGREREHLMEQQQRAVANARQQLEGALEKANAELLEVKSKMSGMQAEFDQATADLKQAVKVSCGCLLSSFLHLPEHIPYPSLSS